MIKRYFISSCLSILTSLVLPFSAKAQPANQLGQWVSPSYVPPLQVSDLQDIKFIDANNGWAVIDGLSNTTDGGITWKNVSVPFTLTSTVLDFVDNQNGWVAGADTIYHTTNGGASWVAQPVNFQTNSPLAIKFVDANSGWAVGWLTRIYRTTNGGTSWQIQHDTIYALNLVDVDFVDLNNGWAVGSGLVYHTTNGGTTWQLQSTTIGGTAVHALNATTAWILGPGQTIYKTTNSGSTWTGSALPSGNSYNDVKFLDATNGFIAAGSDLSSTPSGSVLRTTDGGVSWQTFSNIVRARLNCLSVTSTTQVWVGGQGAVLRTLDGGTTWEIQAANVLNGLYEVASSDGINYWAVGENSTIMRSTDAGKTWQFQLTASPAFFETFLGVHFATSTRGWTVGGNGTIRFTSNGGTSWQSQTSGTTYGLADIFFTDQNNGWICGGNGTILRTTNGGSSWQVQSSGTTSFLQRIVFLDNAQGYTVGDNIVLKTTNGGTNWNALAGSGSFSFNGVSFVDVQRGWICAWPFRILKTSDGGTNWTTQYNPGVQGGRVIRALDSLTAIASGAGVTVATADGGANWNSQAVPSNPDLHGISIRGFNDGVGVGGKTIIRFLSPPNPPQSLTATAGNGQVTLKWSKNTETDFLRYRIYRGTAPNPVTNVDSTTGGINDTVKVMTGLTNGTTYYFRITAVDSVGNESGYSNEVSAMPFGVPTITSFSPTAGPIGTTVAITGTNFSPTPANNIVYFGAVKATVTAASLTSLSFNVPTGATYAPISVTTNGLTAYSNISFIVTFPSSQIIDTTSFAAKLDYAVNVTPYSVAIGDFDIDSKPDIVIANDNGNTVTVYRNVSTPGNITFTSRFDLAAGGGPRSVTTADFNGDGKMDLAVPANVDGVVSILKNTSTTGAISFAPRIGLSAGGAHGVAAGDIDGDGKPDLAVPSFQGNLISVFRNTSSIDSIAFAQKVDLGSGNSPRGIAISDFDGDGKQDIIQTNSGSNTVSVYRNTSTIDTISFAARVDSSTGNTPGGVAVGDIDGDGKPDVTVANSGSNSISVYRNNSTSGSISLAVRIDFATEVGPNNVAIGDLNGDGKPDIAAGNYAAALGTTLSLFRNTGTSGVINSNSFASRVNVITGTAPLGIAVGDLDGDGKPELLSTGPPANSVSVLLNKVAPQSPQNLVAVAGNAQVTLKWMKISENRFLRYRIYGGTSLNPTAQIDSTTGGITDTTKTITGLANGTVYYFRITAVDSAGNESGYSNEVIATPLPIPTVVSVSPSKNALNIAKAANIAVTFNTDIDSATLTNSTIRVNGSQSGLHLGTISYNSSTKTATFDPSVDFQVGEFVWTTLTKGIRNINGDSLVQPLVWSFTLTVNGGTGVFTQSSIISIDSLYYPVSADFDGDGYLDLAMTGTSSMDSVWIFKNDGTARLTYFSSVAIPAQAWEKFGLAAGDVDGDGDIDLVTAYQDINYNSYISILKNTGAGNFSVAFTIAVGYGLNSAKLADLDWDGDLDIAVANNGTGGGVNSSVVVLKNDGTGSFALTFSIDVQGCEFPLAIGDLDNDGDLDIAVSAHCNFGVTILKNDGSGVFSITSVADGGAYPSSVTMGDFDGDGDLDLAIPNRNDASSLPTTISILKNDGNGNFTKTSTPGITGYHTRFVAAVDIDFDGDFDLIAPFDFQSGVGGGVSILRNNGTGTFSEIATIGTGASFRVSFGDFDNDGDVDLVFDGYSSVSIFNNNYNAPPAAPQNLAATAGNAQVTLRWSTNTEPDLLRYRIYGGTAPNPVTKIDSTVGGNPSDTTKVVIGLTNGTLYYFRITAVDSAGNESPYSNEGSATPHLGNYNSDVNTVLLLHMDETSGSTVYDASTYANSGTATGTTIVDGRLGKSRSFNGTSDYLRVPNGVSNANAAFTWEAWAYLRQLPATGSSAAIINQGGNPGQGGVSPALGVHSNGKIAFSMYLTGNFEGVDHKDLFSNVALQTNGWYHVVAVYTTQKMQIYINGSLDRDTIYSGGSQNLNNLYIGANTAYSGLPGDQGYVDGLIDEVRISNIARSPNEFNLQLPPVNLTATPSGTTINLSWLNGGGAVPLLQYKVYRGTDSTSLSVIDSTVSTSYEDSGLTAGPTYYYRVSAVDSTSFEGAQSYASNATAQDVVPPAAPSLVSATAGDGQVTLQWTKNGEGDFLRYRIYFGTSSDPTTVQDSVSNVTDTSKVISGLSNYTTYYFRVTAVDTNLNQSSYSNQLSATPIDLTAPVTPLNLIASAGNSQVTLRWNANTDPDFLRYRIYGGTSQNPITKIDSTTAGITDTTKTITGLTNDTTYYFRITAVDSGGNESGYSNEVSAFPQDLTPPASPTLVSATAGDAQVTTTWTKNSEGDFLRYRIYFGTSSDPTTVQDSVDTISDTSKVISNLTNGSTYYFRVTAVDTNFNESSYSNQLSGTPVDLTAPGAPLSFSATTGNAQVTLRWSQNTEPDFLRYRIYGGTSANPTTKIDSTTGWFADTSRIIAGLTNGTTYYFRITAVDSAGNESAYSNEVSVRPFDLVAYYAFNGNANDSSGNSNHGTTNGGLALTSDRFGNPNNAFLFDGIDDYISIPSSQSLESPQEQITISVWAKAFNWMLNRIPLVEKGEYSSGDTSQYGMIFSDIGGTYYVSLGASGLPPVNLPSSPVLNDWNHHVLTFNGNTLKYYSSGVEIADTVLTQNVLLSVTNLAINIGRDVPGSTEFFDGVMDDIRIYNRALNATEIDSLYRLGGWPLNAAPLAPQNLAPVTGNAQVTLRWNKNTEPDFLRYRIYGGTSPNPVTKIDSTTGGLSDTTKTISALTNGTTYYFRVTAADSAGNESGYSNEVSAMPFDLVAWYPMNGTANDSSGNGNNGTISNTVDTTDRFNIATRALSFDGVSSSISVPHSSSLQPTNTMSIAAWVKPRDFYSGSSGGNGIIYKGIDTEEGAYALLYLSPSHPQALKFEFLTTKGSVRHSAYSQTAITLGQWYFVCGVNKGDSLEIYVNGVREAAIPFAGPIPSNSSGITIGKQDHATNPYYVNGVLDDIQVYNRPLSAAEIDSMYHFGGWPFDIPDAPKNLTSTAGNAQITLRWNSNTEPDFLRYRIYGGTSPDPTTKVDSTTGGITDTTKTITGLTNGTTYYFRITAVDSSGNESGYSNEVSATPQDLTPPVTPTLISAVAGDGKVTLLWTKNSESDFLRYRIYFGTSSDPTTVQDSVNSVTDTSKIISGLTNYTTYYFRVTAVDTNFNESGYSNQLSATPLDITAPSAPLSLSATTGNAQVTLRWSQNTEPDFLRYRIYGGTSANPTTQIDSTTGGISDTTKSITNLTNLTTYYFRITAVDSAGNESGYSAEVSGTPSLSPAVSADSVSNVMSTSAIVSGTVNPNGTSTRAWFDWGTSTAYGNSTPQQSVGSGNIGIVFHDTLKALLPNTLYYYRVVAENNGGSSFSAPRQFTTSSGPAAPPSITSFTPTSGPIGTTVTITGTNFDSTPANNIVYFGAIRATVTSAFSSSISVTVPIGATFAPITVTDTTTGLTAYSSAPFVVTFPSSRIIDASSFAPKIDFTTPSTPWSVAIGDVDGDGKADLAVANQTNNTVSVFRNTSASGSITTGSFAAKIDLTTGATPYIVAIGDVDGDAKADLAVTNWGSNTVSVFRNTSSSGSITASSFASTVGFTTGTNPFYVAIGDLDGDGKPDLVVGNSGSNTVSIFRNTGTSGSITASSFALTVDFTTGSNPSGLAIGDVDGDGKPDLAVTNYFSNTVSVFRNTGTSGSITASSFASKVDFTTTGARARFVALGDLDGDGKPDLVVTNEDTNTVSVFKNTSTSGSITASSFASKVDFVTGTNPHGLAIGDVDGDSKPDLAISNYGSGTVSVFRNTSASGYITASSFAAKVDFTTGTNPLIVAIGDVDGDGKPDLVVANVTSSTVSVLRNTVGPATLLGEYAPDANTVLLLHMNETSGSTVSDVSSYGNNGTATGTTIAGGRFGKARNYSAGSDVITIPNNSSLDFALGDFTIEFWIKTFSSALNIGLSGKYASGTGYQVTLSAGKINFVIGLGAGVRSVDGTVSVNDGQWHHVGVLRSNNNMSIYIDGKLDRTQNYSSTTSASATVNLLIGKAQSFAGVLDGYLEEIRFSNIARSPNEFNLQLPPVNVSATPSGTTINVAWQNGGGAVPLMRYKIYRGADSASVSILDSTTLISYPNINLAEGTYYYRVSAVDSTGFEGAKGYAASATISPPATPILASPADGAVNVDTRPTLIWNPSSGATKYHLQVSQSSTFSTTVYDDSTITTTSRQVGPLQNNRIHYWRVRASNAIGSSLFSTVFSFTTTPAPNHYTVSIRNSFPVPGSSPKGLAWDGTNLWMIDNLDNIFKFDTAGNVLANFPAPGFPDYDLSWDGTGLWIGGGSLGSGKHMKIDPSGNKLDSLLVGHWALSGFEWDGKFFWISDYNSSRVYKHNRNGSEILFFGVDISNSRPNTLSYDGAYLWIGSPGNYISKYSTTGAGRLGLHNLASLGISSGASTTIAWDGQSLWLAKMDGFTIYRLNVPYYHSAPAAPTLISPPDSSNDVTLPPTLSWSPSLDAGFYRLQISTISSFATTVYDDSTITTTSKQVSGLNAGTLYYWRVRAQNSGGASAYSSSRRFRTAGTPVSTALHVSTTGDDGNAGTANAPLRNIQAAISRAAADTIKVEGGTYQENLVTKARTIILGGYDSTFTEANRDIFKKKSIIAPTTGTVIVDSTSCNIDGFLISGTAGATRGIQVTKGSAVITHNIVYGFSRSGGRGIDVASGASALIKNNTVAKNRLSGGGVIFYALYVFGNSSSVVKNNILFHNNVGISMGSSAGTADYNCYFANTTYNYESGTIAGANDLIALNPQFRDTSLAVLDFRLLETSPCVNAGDPADPVGDQQAPYNAQIDMGAYGGTRHSPYLPPVPPAPTLVSPTNGATRQPRSVTLKWNRAPETTSYRLQFSTDPTFNSGLVIDDSTQTDTSEVVSGLDLNTTYYWRVNAKVTLGTSLYSSTFSFSTTDGSLHVSTSGSDSNPGTAALPLRNIQTALARAVADDTVKVSAGIYQENLLTKARAMILGGYEPTFTEGNRDIFNNKSIMAPLEGTAIVDTTNCTIDGFIIDGRSGGTRGIQVTKGNSVITHNIVYGFSKTGGKGIEVTSGASAIIKNNTIAKNRLSGGGVIFYALQVLGTNASVVKNNILFHNNVGIYMGSSSGTADYNCYFANTTYNYESGTIAGGNDLTTVNPQFKDTSLAVLDFRLLEGSGCINAGDPAEPVGEEPAPNGGIIDLGAYGGTRHSPYRPGEPLPPTLIAPADGAISQPTTMTLSWNPSADATAYRVEVSLESNFSTITLSDSIPGTSRVLSGLSNGSIYYWRVQAMNISGESAFTQPRRFTTVGLLAEYNPDPNTVLLLHMNETSGSSVRDISGNDNNGVATGTTIVDGRFGKARQFSANTDTINVPRNNIKPLVFTVESWINVASYSSASPQFIVSNLHSGVDKGFFLVVQTDGRLHFNVGNGPNNHLYSTSTISINTWYHVAGTFDGSLMGVFVNGVLEGTSNWNDIGYETDNAFPLKIGNHNLNPGDPPNQNFNGFIDEVRISNIARSPNEFNLQLPPRAEGATPNGTTIDVSWFNGGGAAPLMRYRIYRGLDSTNVSLIDSTTNTIYSNTALNPTTTYYYRITAVDSTGFESARSYARSATTGSTATPQTPTLLSPANGATNQASGVQLTWNSANGALSYHIQVSTDSTFASVDFQDSTLTSTSYQNTLVPSTKYFWRVRAKNAVGASLFSSVWNFRTYDVASVPFPPSALTATVVSSSQINISWSDNSNNEDGFRIERKTGVGGTYSEITLVGQDATSYSDMGLSEGTTYFYRIRSYNAVGNSSYSAEASATTPDVAPISPINPQITPSGWTNQGIFTITWTNPFDASGIAQAWYRLNAIPTLGSPGTSVNITSPTFQLTVSVEGATTINFYLADGAGNKNPSSYVSVMAKYDNGLPTLNHDSTNVAVFTTTSPTSIGINATASDAVSGMKLLQLHYRRSGASWASASIGDYSSSSGGMVQIPALFLTANANYGVDYRIMAEDSAGNRRYTPTFSIAIRYNQEASRTDGSGNPILQPSTSSLAAGIPPEYAYRMFSVPLDLDIKTPQSVFEIRTLLGSYDTKKWRFFRLNSDDSFSEYPEISTLPILESGKAFLLILKTSTVLKTGPGTVLRADSLNKAGLQLRSGNNFVGNPFNFDVAIDSLSLSNGDLLNNRTWSFVGVGGTNGGWTLNPAVLKPWEGILVRTSSAALLKFNITDRPSSQAFPSAAYIREEPSGGSWRIRINALRSDNGLADIENLAGVDSRALNGLDHLDVTEPPLFGEKTLSLSFPSPEAELTHDIRPLNEEGYVWNFKVTTPDNNAKVMMSFEGVDAVSSPVFLLDLDTKMPHRLNAESRLEVNTFKGQRNFRLIVGSLEFAEKHNNGIDLVPKEFALYQNYPNPFNPETVIRYSLPNASFVYKVSLKVYNLLGQEVATLVEAEQSSGFYEAKLEGRNLTTGAYFYRFVVSGESKESSYTSVKRMMLMK